MFRKKYTSNLSPYQTSDEVRSVGELYGDSAASMKEEYRAAAQLALDISWLRHCISSGAPDKPSRQLVDNRKTVIYLVVRTLQRKTRQSDSFFEKFLFLLKISVYVHLLLISVTANQYYFYPPIIFSSAMSSFGTHNLYLCRRNTKQHHHDNKTHIMQDTHQSDKTLLSLYHDSNHKRMLLRNRA